MYDKRGRAMVTTEEAAKRFGVRPAYIRQLSLSGELTRVVESPRRVFYYVEEVERIAAEKAALRKKRGGRPRSGGQVA